jgi:S-adenosylmethionine:tRNA-ribosyltransferase-isomerase (queuine synthetase)
LRFLYDGSYEEFRKIDRTWRNPIPKYIRDVTPEDAATKIYAKEEGAVGAPTAGLHSLNIY